MSEQAEVLARLQQEILSLQGFKPACSSALTDVGLGSIYSAFLNSAFPLPGVHEFLYTGMEAAAATGAFVAGLLSSIKHKRRITLWISASRALFPPALKRFGISPDQIIFIDLKSEREVSWAIAEALHCTALAAVVGELSEMSFTDSRRFQLAIERSRVPLFVLRCNPRNRATASLIRWQLRPLPSRLEAGLPGVGHPCWQVTLLKVRGGRPGVWNIEWSEDRFRHESKLVVVYNEGQKKAG